MQRGARGRGAFAAFLPDRALTLASDRARAKNNGATMMGEACDDLKFQRPDRILHRHDALPSLAGVFQIRSSQQRRAGSAATDIPGDNADAKEAQVRDGSREKGAGICSECYIVLSLTLLGGGWAERLRPGAIAAAVIHDRRSVREKGLPTWPILERADLRLCCCMFQRMLAAWVSCSSAADLNALLIDAGTKLHRAGWEAGSARVPAGERASDIGQVGRKFVSYAPVWWSI